MRFRNPLLAIVTAMACCLTGAVAPLNAKLLEVEKDKGKERQRSEKATEKERQKEQAARDEKAAEERARRQKEHKEKMDRLRQEAEARNQKRLEEAKEKFESASHSKDSNPVTFINSISYLAYCYRGVKQNEKADALYQQVFAMLKNGMSEGEFEAACQFLWKYLGDYADASTYKDSYGKLIDASEVAGITDFEIISDSIRDFERRTEDHRKHDRSAWCKTILKKAIDVRTQQRGANEKSLAPLYLSYSRACERGGEIDEAEKALLQAESLSTSKSADRSASTQLTLASFYLRQRMLDKAEAAWQKARSLERGHYSRHVAQEFIDLASAYEKASRIADSERIMFTLLEDGGDQIVQAFDPKIELIYDNLLRSCQFDRAEKLVKTRLMASANCRNDPQALEWRIKLSELYLSMGRTQESEALFKQIIAANALQGVPSDNLLREREYLKERLKGGSGSRQGRSFGMFPQGQATLRDPGTPFKIQFGLLGLDEVRLGHNATVQSYDSSVANPRPYAYRGRAGGDLASICSFGVTRVMGNLTMRGTIYGKVEPADRNPSRHIVHVPIAFNVSPANDPPTTAKELPKDPRNISGKLEPGDYFADEFHGNTYGWPIEGRYRIFLLDRGKATQENVLDISSTPNARRPVNLQIYYNGTKKIKLGTVNAVVYAPNALVELNFNATFCGAIVARRIITEGNNTISFDTTLTGMDFDEQK